jgi:2'-5' RNA ligase
MTRHRYFYCLRPPPPLARSIGLLRDELRGGGARVSNARLHMTLAITNDHPRPVPELAAALLAIGGIIDAEPFRLVLDRLCGSHSTIALRPSRRRPELGILQRQIQRRLASRGIARDGWAFSPHMTLQYRAGRPFVRPVRTFEWHAAEAVLIHSLVGETRHETLGHGPLERRQLALPA